MEEIKKGNYRHYKGSEYKIISEAKHSGTKEEMVVYQDLKDEKKVWVRPKKNFLAAVKVKREKKPRFEFIKEEEIDSYKDKYLRALADYQNLMKQTASEKLEFVKYAANDFLQDILPIYDHLKLSTQGLSEEEKKNPWAQGVTYVLKQFQDVLKQRGVEEIKTVGEKFDHNTMEAVEGSGDTVSKEVIPGYKLNGKVIRHAKVIVS